MNSQGWKIVWTKAALKDKHIATAAGFGDKINSILALLRENPFAEYPPYEKLLGDLSGAYSRRLNRKHRVIYQVYKEERTIKIISTWLHYE